MALLHTPEVEFGWPSHEFKLKDPEGTVHSLNDTLTDKGVLIAFLCNHCPYVQAIADRLATDFAELQDAGIGVLAVMSNDYHAVPSDGPEYMAEFAKKHGWTFPYLIDEDQMVAKTYDAVCTPDFFGFNGDALLQYRGRLDDAAMGDGAGRRRELVNAMLQIADGKSAPKDQTPSMGCSIKWR